MKCIHLNIFIFILVCHGRELWLLMDNRVHRLGGGVALNVLAPPHPVALPVTGHLTVGPIHGHALFHHTVTMHHFRAIDGNHHLVLQPLLGDVPQLRGVVLGCGDPH